jgi:hypothetical protein
MKYCPTCQITYADESLRFCLQDGTGLLNYPGSAPAPTVDFSEKETVVRQNPPAPTVDYSEKETVVRQNPPTADWQPARETRGAVTQPDVKKSNPLLMVIAISLVMLVIFGGIGLGWLLLKDDKSLSNLNGPDKTSPKPTVSATADDKDKNRNTGPDSPLSWGPIDYNASYDGERITYYPGTTVERCQADCDANPNCRGFTLIRAGAYNPQDPPMCYLMSKMTKSTFSSCCISRVKK